MGVTAGQKVAVGVWIDIVEDGPTMGACRTTGSLSQSIEPNLDDFGIWAKVEGGVTTVRRLTTDEVIVQARGWAKAMQALADKFGEAVEVSCDPGMGNAITAKMVGTWEPDAAKTAMTAASNAADALANAQQSLGNADSFLADAFANLTVLDKMWSCTLCGDRFATGAESIAHQCAPRGWDNSGPSVAGHPCDICCEIDCRGHMVERWASVPTPMRPARKGRVSRRGKTTRRQRARNRG